MKKSASDTAQTIAKYLIFAGVVVSTFFIGYRIVTRSEYAERELAQCRALAVSAALAACGALGEPELAAYICSHGETKFIIDHMQMPGHNVVSVTLAPNGGSFSVLARAETNWNSRSPQKADFRAVKCEAGMTFSDDDSMAKALLTSDGRESPIKKTLTFSFPNEKQCPVPFYVTAIKMNGIYKTPLTVLLPAERQAPTPRACHNKAGVH